MFDAYGILERVKEKRPLIHHITNWVTIYDCANITRTFGGLPVMAHAREEVEQMVALANALVLNIGTLTPELVDTMMTTARAANKRRIPVVLDAVGAGATSLRTDSAISILNGTHVDVLKGNYGEMGAIAGVKSSVRGVESEGIDADPTAVARKLSADYRNTVVMTGKTDIVCGGGEIYLVDNGHRMMGSIVGTGCMAASVIACFAAVEGEHQKASAAAMACFDIAGELAAENARGPGSYKEAFYDAAYRLTRDEVESIMRVNRV